LPAATEPFATTRPHAPHVAVPPPGFHKITVDSYSAFCQPVDDDWVHDALAAIAPTTRPTTMPAEHDRRYRETPRAARSDDDAGPAR